MCGIVGLFLKDAQLAPDLGGMLAEMLVTMTDRGPDSAGIAIYGSATEGLAKLTVQTTDPEKDFNGLAEALSEKLSDRLTLHINDTHAILTLPQDLLGQTRALLAELRPGLRVMSAGDRIEIYKEVGTPASVSDRFGLSAMAGSHGIGHTRMATESAVTTMGAHPFSTGSDQCLAHNGSLSNHNRLRRTLQRDGMKFETENDSEVAAAYLTHRMRKGDDLGTALTAGLRDLDGFYTFVVGTRSGFGVLRDPVACKPALLAETDRYVAFGSEYRAMVGLPGIDTARIWEPEPATPYFWKQ